MSTALSKAAAAVDNHMAWRLFVDCLPEENLQPLRPLFQAFVANFSEEALPLARHQQLIYYATCQHVWKQLIQPPLDRALETFTEGKRLSKMNADEKKAYTAKVEAAVSKKVTELLYQFSGTYDLDLDVKSIDIVDLVREGTRMFKLVHNHYRAFEKVRASNTQSLTEQVKAFTGFFQATTTSVTSFLQTHAITLFLTVVGHIRNKKMADFCADNGIQLANDASHLFGELTKRIHTVCSVMLSPKPPAPPQPAEAIALPVLPPAVLPLAPPPEAEEVVAERDSKAGPEFVHTFDKARAPATKQISPNLPARATAKASDPAAAAPLPHPLQPLISSLYKVIREVQSLPKREAGKAVGAFDATKLFHPETLLRYAGTLGVQEDALHALFDRLTKKAPQAEERAELAGRVTRFITHTLEKALPPPAT